MHIDFPAPFYLPLTVIRRSLKSLQIYLCESSKVIENPIITPKLFKIKFTFQIILIKTSCQGHLSVGHSDRHCLKSHYINSLYSHVRVVSLCFFLRKESNSVLTWDKNPPNWCNWISESAFYSGPMIAHYTLKKTDTYNLSIFPCLRRPSAELCFLH